MDWFVIFYTGGILLSNRHESTIHTQRERCPTLSHNDEYALMLYCVFACWFRCSQLCGCVSSSRAPPSNSMSTSNCVLCHNRIPLKPTKDTRPHNGGRAHQHCIKADQRRSCVKRAISPSLQLNDGRHVPPQPTAAAATAASSPILDETTTASTGTEATRHSLDVYGYARVRSTETSRHVAWDVMRLCPSHRAKGSTTISGKVKQIDLTIQTDSGAELHALVPRWVELIHNTAASLGIAHERLHAVDPKLLVAFPGLGHQAVHWDCARDEFSAQKYSFILYCSAGSYSTALPKFPADNDLSFSSDRAKMQKVAHLLGPDNYESLPVLPGDIVVFRQSTPHFGVANVCKQADRVVLFGMLSPSPESMQDARQVYPWLYIPAAFGYNSSEYARALVDGREFSPLERIRQDDGLEGESIARACLKKWKLLSEFQSNPYIL